MVSMFTGARGRDLDQTAVEVSTVYLQSRELRLPMVGLTAKRGRRRQAELGCLGPLA